MSAAATRARIVLGVTGVVLACTAAAWQPAWSRGDAPPTPAGCDDLSAIPIQFNIAYEDIQEVWVVGGCTGCHNGSEMGGLRLDIPNASILQLVLQPSWRDNERIRVIPQDPDGSLLHELLSCTVQPPFVPMPPSMSGTRIDAALRARVYDWIAEGARGVDKDGNPVSGVIFSSRFESQRFQQGLD